jgi:micrococcal nuclease
MTSYGTAGVALGVLLLLALAAFDATTPVGSEPDGRHAAAHVVRVRDGDTLVARLATIKLGLKNQETVRLVGIDCPESGQPGGPRAAARLTSLVLRRPVILEIAPQARDRHGRLLAGVYLADGTTLVQELLVREGFCRTLVIPPNVDYVEQLRAAMTEAQRAERGIWARSAGPVEDPARYRSRHR